MTVIPAIDLIGGQCVRLLHGRYDEQTTYSKEPADTARRFAGAGARWIHIVDLDAARRRAGAEGEHNRPTIGEIRKAVPCRLEVGGGIRNEDDVRELLDLGIDRLVLGTILARDPDKVAEWISRFGNVFMAGIDAMEGKVKVSGWEHDSGVEDVALASGMKDLGMQGIVYTSIGRDGTLEGPDIERTNRIAGTAGLPVILSGGIGSMEDVEAVSRGGHPLIRGLITGKALYEGRLDLAELFLRFPADDGNREGSES